MAEGTQTQTIPVTSTGAKLQGAMDQMTTSVQQPVGQPTATQQGAFQEVLGQFQTEQAPQQQQDAAKEVLGKVQDPTAIDQAVDTAAGLLPVIEAQQEAVQTIQEEPQMLTPEAVTPDVGPLEIKGLPEDIEGAYRPYSAGTSNFAALARSVGQEQRAELSAQQTYDQSTVQERKPLHQRHTVEDYHRVNTVTYSPETKTYSVEAEHIGTIANGQYATRSRKTKHEVKAKNVQKGAASLTNFLANYQQWSAGQQVIGLADLYYDMMFNFASGEDRDKLLYGRREFNGILQNYNLFNNWGRYNNYKRFNKTANTLLNNGRMIMGEEWYRDLVGTSQSPTGMGAFFNGMNVLNFGYSAYNLLEYWDKMNTVQRVGALLNTVNSGMQAYQGLEAVGNYLNSTAATGVGTGAAGATGAGGAGATGAGGAGATGAGGAGAAGGAEGAGAAGGTTAPTSGFQATQQGQFGGYLQTAAALYAAYQIVDQWGTGGAEGRASGAANGAAIGTYFLPGWGTLIGAAVGLAIGSIKTGKSNEQGKRDYYRGHYEKNRVFEKVEGLKGHQVQLADGTFYDVGQDGSGSTAMYNGQVKTFANPHLIAERDRDGIMEGNQMRPYEVDYTNDLDFATHMASKGLNLIMMGGSVDNRKQSEATQMNGYLTNAATSNLASREFNEENYKGAMANVRQFYAKAGIESKAQGIEMANALYQDGRMSKGDFNAMLFGLEFAFSDDFATAQAIMAEMGRGGPMEDRVADTTTMEEFKAAEDEDKAAVYKKTEDAQRARGTAMFQSGFGSDAAAGAGGKG